jgi:hypothetical protein
MPGFRLRGIVTSAVFGVLSLGMVRSLRAECVQEPWPDDPPHYVCTSCTSSTCCHTHWIGDVRTDTWCHDAET